MERLIHQIIRELTQLQSNVKWIHGFTSALPCHIIITHNNIVYIYKNYKRKYVNAKKGLESDRIHGKTDSPDNSGIDTTAI